MNEQRKGTSSGLALCATLLVAIVLSALIFDRGSSTPDDNVIQPVTKEAPPVVFIPATVQSSIKMITPADYAAELDTSDSVLIQLCLPQQCAADRAVLERISPSFSAVKFVQMSTADNAEFSDRLKAEQEALIKQNSAIKPLAYPVYIFKGADLQIAPVTSEEELRKFVEMNVSAREPEDAKEEPKQ